MHLMQKLKKSAPATGSFANRIARSRADTSLLKQTTVIH